MPIEPPTSTVRRIRPQILLDPRYEHWLLALMLGCLHISVWGGFGGALSRSLMLAHLGLFLIWQPLWSRERRLSWSNGLVYVAATLAFIVWMSWPLVSFWLLLLTGFVGRRVKVGRANRYAYLLALVFLVSELLIGCIPPMVRVPALPADAKLLFAYAMALVPIGLFFIPVSGTRARGDQSVDFLHGLTASLLVTVLGMGSLLDTYVTGARYPVAVIQTILAISAFLLAIGWLWSPLAGFSGLGQLWERYVQNIGTPFEQWLSRLTGAAQRHSTPEAFLAAAMLQLSELAWVRGVSWRGEGVEGMQGELSEHQFRTRAGGVLIEVSAERPVGATLLLHGHLLVRLMGHFYQAKRRERELAQRAHLQAVYETGARVTHDIKNLLQSLHTLSVALQDADGAEREAVQRLLARQLPHITQRLQLALDKLQAPADSSVPYGDLGEWWESACARNEGRDVVFNAAITEPRRVPIELFDSVVENLLDNARIKRQSEPGIAIRVDLVSDAEGLRLAVSDSGSGIEDETARQLFRGPVDSRSGLGIGLYQAARLAEQLGYRLRLRDGVGPGVCVELLEARQSLDSAVSVIG
jgi:signal transduction histidine kinase